MKITRKIELDYGHTLPNHFSFCSQIHGHRATVEATVEGDLQDEGSSQGMVMDFHFLKKALVEQVHDRLDHEFAVWEEGNDEDMDYIMERNENPLVLDEPPTAENLAKWAYEQVEPEIPDGISLVNIKWEETPNNWVVYDGSEVDNIEK